MSEELIWRLVQLVSAVVVFLVFVVRFPDLIVSFVERISKLKIEWKKGELFPSIELERATEAGAEAVSQREGKPANKARLRQDLERLPRARLLWVDDNPEYNEREIQALELAGLFVDTARSNEEAARRVVGREYDLVISDINRQGEEPSRAGLELPKKLMPDRNRVPPIIYYVGKVKTPFTPDGYPVTNQPSELFRMIGDVLWWKT